MKYGFLFFLCSIVIFTLDATCFDIIRDFLFPRMPMVTKVKRIEDPRAVVDGDFAVLNTMGLVSQHGYPIEEHKVTTADGYIIIFFRIHGSPASPRRRGKPVVFLQHGILASSDAWVLFGPGKDLAFLLADKGYEVWIGNVRGNSYGRSHTVLSPLDPEFWKFSFHEIAVCDLPSMIDYILKYTGQRALSYVGHSMGTTVAYVLLSEMPVYNDKIRLVVSLAPIAFWKEWPSLAVRLTVQNGDVIKHILDESGVYEIGPQTTNNGRLGRAFCSDSSLTQAACLTLFSVVAGDDPDHLNSTLLPYILSYYPAGASSATLYHYQQNLDSGTFRQFDLGFIENFRLYGEKKPPIYDVKKISAPVALIYGKTDALSIEPNIAELSNKLQNVVAFEAVPSNTFNHLDFLWANDAKALLYDRIIELITIYSR